jgi:hypothetical protein
VWNAPPTIRQQFFERGYNLTGRHVRVKMAGDTIEPLVDAFTGAWRRGQHVAQKWRNLAIHPYSNSVRIVLGGPSLRRKTPAFRSLWRVFFLLAAGFGAT